MAAADNLQSFVTRTRPGFEQEGVWMRFLVDAYTGGGGFQGRLREAPSGFWGAVSSAYDGFNLLTALRSTGGGDGRFSDALLDTYLDRHHREENDKFRRRVAVSHYLNYIKPTTNLKISYLARKPHRRRNVPPKLQDWIDRTNYDAGFRQRALVTAVLGWFPMLVDLPSRAGSTEAQAQQQSGERDPYAVLTLPVQLIDYELDERGVFVWAKTALTFTRRATWDVEPQRVTRTTVWTASEFVVFEGVDGQAPAEVDSGTHPFIAVPIVSWRSDMSVEDPVKADSINRDIANECRRLFNLLSELDEHLRGQVFALLVYPASSPTPTDSVVIGNENGLQISAEQKNVPFYLAPPSSIAETYEARIEASVIEVYRMARVEYDRASGTQSSAQSRQQNFEQTNLAIVDLAQSIARADRDTLILVGRGLGIAEPELQQIECIAYESYASEDLSLELEQAISALTIKELGPQAHIEILSRLAQQLLPQLGSDTKKIIESEIEESVAQSTRDAEMAAEAAEAMEGAVESEDESEEQGDGDGGSGGPGEEDEDGAQPDAAQ
jgi:hypothetical protein